MAYSQDYTTQHVGTWKKVLAKFVGKPNIHAIEIGAFEGRSSVWFVQNVLQHGSSRLICIDPFVQASFFSNIAPHRGKITLIKRPSAQALKDSGTLSTRNHFIYIDGAKAPSAVLENAVLTFPLLALGGILIFDDYLWKPVGSSRRGDNPKLGIDSFLDAYVGKYKILHRGWQIILEKVHG